jgi:replicative DNA helicase
MNTEFESILLKKLVYCAPFYGKVMPILKKKFFTEIGNQELFSLIQNYYKEYRNIPTLTELVASVKNVSNAEVRNEIVKSLQLISKTEEVQNVEFMCNETVSWVKDAMYMDALQIGSDGLMKKDDALKLKAQQILDERAKVSIDTDLGLDLDDLDTMIEYYSERMTGIRTQHNELNKRLGPGFLPGTLSVILAASGVGKSLLMTDLVSGMLTTGKNILLVSLEMADKEIMKRVHANAMNLPINSLLDLSKTEGELAKLNRPIIDKAQIISAYERMKTSGTCGKFFVKDYPSGSFSPLMLEQLVESYRIERNINFDIVFVDYIGIMKSDLLSPSAGLYSYVKSIAEEVRATAKKLQIPIISASQLNRSSTNSIDEVDNSNVSDSMGTVMTADFMLFLLQNEEMKEKKEIVCKITKNRFAGRTDTWLMNIDYEHMRFADMLIQNAGSDIDSDVNSILGVTRAPAVNDDFGVITATKQKAAEEYAASEIKQIVREDVQKVREAQKDRADTSKPDPFNSDIDKLYAELGI